MSSSEMEDSGAREVCCDSKAQVMRRLIASYAEIKNEVRDGVKSETASSWILVRPCAGREELEAFKCEKVVDLNLEQHLETETLFGRMLKDLRGWIEEISRENGLGMG